MFVEQRREQFKADVAELKLKARGRRKDGLWRAIGALLMLVGVVAAFLVYEVSLSKSDFRDIQSEQILAIAFLALAVLGAALYIAAAVASLLRVWLLRQLYEGQQQVEALTEALRARG
jgi:uncharacterized membrane protein YcjF (UPF0283 family)